MLLYDIHDVAFQDILVICFLSIPAGLLVIYIEGFLCPPFSELSRGTLLLFYIQFFPEHLAFIVRIVFREKCFSVVMCLYKYLLWFFLETKYRYTYMLSNFLVIYLLSILLSF